MGIGDRGKYSEGEVRKWMENRAKKVGFSFKRMPDARAGSKVATLSDFIAKSVSSPFTLIEVKEVDHIKLLPYKNLDTGQAARMQDWINSGAEAYVLVYFKKANVWRVERLAYFQHRNPDAGSWDMSNSPAYSNVGDILGGLFC